MEDLEQTSRLVFHGAAYVVTASVVSGSTVRVEAETEDGESRWRGDFPAKYVEGITQKTGSAKKFPVFVKMLLTALGHGSDSLFVDLLTYADLELLKARRAGGASGYSSNNTNGNNSGNISNGTSNGNINGNSNGNINSISADTDSIKKNNYNNINNNCNNKRYLILTYAAEYDRVHYPLPLACVDSPGREQLERTVRRLREDLSRRSLEGVSASEATSASHPAASQLRAENGELRQRLEMATARLDGSEASVRSSTEGGIDEDAGAEGANGREGGDDRGAWGGKLRKLRRANEELRERLDNFQAAHERLRLDSAGEIRKLRRAVREGTRAAEMKASTAGEAAEQVAVLREELDGHNQRLLDAQEVHHKEIDKVKKELAKERVTSRVLRSKIHELSALRATPDPRTYQKIQQRSSSARSSPATKRRGASPVSTFGRPRRSTGAASSRLRSGGSGWLADSSSTNQSRQLRVGGGGATTSTANSRGRSPSTKNAFTRGGRPRLGRSPSANAGGGSSGSRRKRQGRLDSPRHPPVVGRSSSRLGGWSAGSRASSRGSSLESSKGRSRSTSKSTSSRRERRDSRSTVSAVFDPTAYQREREQRLKRLEEERRKRERQEIAYSPARNSGRDSWIPASGDGGPESLTGVARGRSLVRGGSSGYASAGSRESRASRGSRGSSTRSRLSPSGRSDTSSRTPSKSRRPTRSTSSTGPPPAPARKTSTAGAVKKSTSSNVAATTRSRLGGLSTTSPASPLQNRSRAFTRREVAGSAAPRGRWEPPPAKARWRYDGKVTMSGGNREGSRIRPRNSSSSPRNYVRRARGDGDARAHPEGGNADGSGLLRLVRNSDNSSASFSGGGVDSSHASEETGWPAMLRNGGSSRNIPQGLLAREKKASNERLPTNSSWREYESENFDEEEEWQYRELRKQGRSGTPAGVGPVNVLVVAPSQDPHTATETYDTVGGISSRILRDELHPRTSTQQAFTITSDRNREHREGEGREAGVRVSMTGSGLASSGGSLGTSSQRSARRRVELRTPAEEEAVRKSQELTEPLKTRRTSAVRHPFENGAAVATGEVIVEAGGGGSSERTAGVAYKPSMEAGREISDIDRRLGELHEFLRRAKAGSTGGVLPLPLPPPVAAVQTHPATAAGDIAWEPITAGLESQSAERRPPSPPLTDVAGASAISRSNSTLFAVEEEGSVNRGGSQGDVVKRKGGRNSEKDGGGESASSEER